MQTFPRKSPCIPASNPLTMYDLPSEFPGAPGLPDEYHDLQPEFLSATLQLTAYSQKERFTGTDMCLYYDPSHPLWHKRPDWFLALGVPRLYNDDDLRLSYVVEDEGIVPSIIIELLSPGTEKQDLGPFYRTTDIIEPGTPDEPEVDEIIQEELLTLFESRVPGSQCGKPPAKWTVYQDILKVPYYITYSRYTNTMRAFRWVNGRYVEVRLDPENPRFWIEELNIGLGIWRGEYQCATRPWLRWYDAAGEWMATREERAEQRAAVAEQQAQAAEQQAQAAEQQAQAAEQQAQAAEQQAQIERQLRLELVERLKKAGIDIDDL